MVAGDDSSNEDANTSEDDDGEASERIKHISGDDLGDSFSDAIPRAKAVWIDDILTREGEREDAPTSGEEETDDEDEQDDDDEEDEEDEEEEDEEESGENEKGQSLKDWEQSDDDHIDSKEEEEDDDSDDGTDKLVVMENQKKVLEGKGRQNDDASAHRTKINVKEDVHKKGDLPYTIEAPKDFEEFSALLQNRSDDQIVEAIRRIRTYNAIAVAAENRKKMQVRYLCCFYVLLLLKTTVSISNIWIQLDCRCSMACCCNTLLFQQARSL